ncbi:MAG: peptide-methionine (S)-S-oxide reductase MsrA [Burkholderiales bacterium]|nr:peptide-methionine (S)-S-oxide reductase MsrA [Burkholderiales bacterium]
MAQKMATLGGGSFWSTEAVFQQVRGVRNVVPGYSGGYVQFPTYEDICEGNTGHAEVVRFEFDTDVVSFRELLGVFFAIHDPTSLDRQGNDIGTRYRSVIYFHDAEQQAVANQLMREVANRWNAPIVTELTAAPAFYPAEDYHHNFYKLNSHQAYCAQVVAPKIEQARRYLVSACVP